MKKIILSVALASATLGLSSCYTTTSTYTPGYSSSYVYAPGYANRYYTTNYGVLPAAYGGYRLGWNNAYWGGARYYGGYHRGWGGGAWGHRGWHGNHGWHRGGFHRR